MSEAKVSVGRIQKFLEMPELCRPFQAPLVVKGNVEAAVTVSRATCHWGNSDSHRSDNIDTNEVGSPNVALTNIDLKLDMGTLTCVIGEVRHLFALFR